MEEGGAVEKREKKAEEEEKKKKEVKDKYEPEIERLKKMAASVWITEMRFARRADVSSDDLSSALSLVPDAIRCSLAPLQGVKPARQVFTKARKSPHLAWQVIEASGKLRMSKLRHVLRN